MEVLNKNVGFYFTLLIMTIFCCNNRDIKILPLHPTKNEDSIGDVKVNTYYYLVYMENQKNEIVFESLRKFSMAKRTASQQNLIETFIFYRQGGSLNKDFKESADNTIDDFQDNILYSFTFENNVLSWIEYLDGKPVKIKSRVSDIGNSN